MHLGICTTDFPTMSARDLFETIAGYGFSSIQLNASAIAEAEFEDTGEFEIPGAIDAGVLSEITRRARDAGLRIAAANGTFNCAHPDAAARREGLARFAGFAGAVHALGCRYISLCTGTRNTQHLWRAHPDNDSPEAWADMEEVMRGLVRIAAPLG